MRVAPKVGEEQTVTATIPKEELEFRAPDGWARTGKNTVYVGTDSSNAAAI